MIELLTVVIVLSVLAGIALLKYLDLRNTARAAEVAGDFRTVTVAAYNYHADNDAWPGDGAPGVTPPALASYLPGSFSFTKPEYTLDYENLGLGGGAFVIGVTVTSPNADLMSRLIRNLGNKHPYFAAGGTLTYIISEKGGA
jgi:type II secretory pathway pseudopilin PulG